MPNFINLENLKKIYQNSRGKLKSSNKPLTLTEKIIFSHLYNEDTDFNNIKRGETELKLAPDRVAMQDATAQMAILQFISVGVQKVATPTSIHCDHLIRANIGAKDDLKAANNVNKEVYDFLGSAAKKYGMDFWKPGSGIIHQIVLENYAFPGGMIIGTDSHTPTGGGIGNIAIGVGGADAVDVMTKQPWLLKMPKIVGVHLTGSLEGWTSSKDVILYLIGKLSVKGGTGKVFEYFGSGAESLSCTGKATITNMGAELGATTSIFPYDEKMKDYLKATNREAVSVLTDEFKDIITADLKVLESPNEYYDEVIEIDLSKLEPSLSGPHTPDAYFSISEMNKKYKELELPETISSCLIGSCTNSSYEDMSRAYILAKFAYENGIELKTDLIISPGSNQISQTMEREGFTKMFENIGGKVVSNSCGPCIGQWERKKIKNIQEGEKNVIITTFNRNFKARNDGRNETQAFLSSPELVMALALSGKLSFNPMTDTIKNKDGKEIKLEITNVDELPKDGFAKASLDYEPPAEDGSNVDVEINPDSERIQLLEPFKAWNMDKDFNNLLILLKSQGKCTTDNISPAGPWLKFRGHLDNISNNMFSGATNSFTSEIGKGKNIFTGETKDINQVAREYKKNGTGWIVIGDENYGEGSSREHAAMEPRFLGCRAIISKSFARIAETNLKKQGLLPLWLKEKGDYLKFHEDDKIDLLGCENLSPGSEIILKITHKNSETDEITLTHTLSHEEIKWFYAGSALNKAGKDLRGEN